MQSFSFFKKIVSLPFGNTSVSSWPPIIFSFYSQTSIAEVAAEDHWYSGFSILAGSVYRDIDFSVYENNKYSRGISVEINQSKNTAQSKNDNALGVLVGNKEWYPVMMFSTPSFYFKSVVENNRGFDLGWFVNAGINHLSIDRQLVQIPNTTDKQNVQLGTFVQGDFVYVVPLVFVNFGDKQVRNDSLSAKLGLGLGVGYMYARGDVILDKSKIRLPIDINQLAFASGFLAEFRYGHFVMTAQSGGPRFFKGDYEYTVSENGFSFGYIFVF